MGGHDSPLVGLAELDRLDGLGDGSDLVDLEQKTVAGLLLDGGLDSGDVGDGQVISDNLGLGVLGKVGPRSPVVLVEGVLDGDDGVLGDHVVVLGSELLTRDPLGGVRVGVLEVKIAEKKSKVSFSRKLSIVERRERY